MIFDVSYWTRVFKRILYVVFILLGLYIGLKLSVFYMPFFSCLYNIINGRTCYKVYYEKDKFNQEN